MPGILSELSSEIFNSNNYVMQVWDSVASELAGRSTMQQNLNSKRATAAEQSVLAAEKANLGYIQQIRAAWGDLMSVASTVPAVVEQSEGTIKNDDNLSNTTVNVSNPAINKDIAVAKEELPIEAEKKLLADTVSVEGSNPLLVAKVMQQEQNVVTEGLVASFLSGNNMMPASDAATMASIDCTKEIATAMMKQTGEDFAKEIWSLASEGALSPNALLATFDDTMAKAGTVIGNYLGAAVGGVPNGNPCASQTLSSFGAKCSLLANTLVSGVNMLSAVGRFGVALANQANNIYQHGPEILVGMAETLAQTAVNTAFLAIRVAAKRNCAVQFAVDAAQGLLNVAEVTVEGGIAVINTAQELKSSVDDLIHTVETFDIKKRTEDLVKSHPLVRTMDTLLKGTNVDLRTYLHLTGTGIKFARISLGADQQNKLSSVMYHKQKCIRDAWSVGLIKRRNYTTDMTINRYNAYGYLPWYYN